MKKTLRLEGALPQILNHEIYLNVTQLQEGWYELKIVSDNKLIGKTMFKKTTGERS